MIAGLLLRLGIPQWAAELVAIVALAGAAYTGMVWHDHKTFQAGVASQLAIDAQAALAAERENTRLNLKMAKLQGSLDKTMADLTTKTKDVNDEKAKSAALQSDLAASRRRLSVLARARPADPADAVARAGAASVDSGRAVTVDLDGGVAADLEWLRQTREDALKGLSGCITAYGAVKATADKAEALDGIQRP